jgi:hypothetical protein
VTGLLGEFGVELGRSFADKWVSWLALPGALFLAAFATACTLGQDHALDVSRLTSQVTAWAHDAGATTAGGQIVVLAAVLAAALTVGLAAGGLGAALERIVLAADWRSWPSLPRTVARRRTESRRLRWDIADQRYNTQLADAARAVAVNRQPDAAVRHDARRARNAIAMEQPDRPTWSGDRIHAVAVRLRRDHRLELPVLWPYLWLLLPDQDRKEIVAARYALTRAVELGAWAVLYVPLIYLWWPASAIVLVLGVLSRERTRSAADGYARLIEAAVRLHARDVAHQLGIDFSGPLPVDAGDRISEVIDSVPRGASL